MKVRFLIPVLAAGLVSSGLARGVDAPAKPVAPAPAPAAAASSLDLGDGFPVSHYETLWSKSPFAVASPEAGPESPDYKLEGIAQVEGISYASLSSKQTPQEHFVVTTEKPVKGLTLVSITPGHGATATVAVFQKDGQSLTLKMEPSAVGATSSMPISNVPPAPYTPPPPIFPGPTTGGFIPGLRPGTQLPPPAYQRRRMIPVPPQPGQPAAQPGAQPATPAATPAPQQGQPQPYPSANPAGRTTP